MIEIFPGTDCLCDFQNGHGLAQTGRFIACITGRVITHIDGVISDLAAVISECQGCYRVLSLRFGYNT